MSSFSLKKRKIFAIQITNGRYFCFTGFFKKFLKINLNGRIGGKTTITLDF